MTGPGRRHNRRVNGTLVLLVIIVSIAVTSLAKRRDLQVPLILVAVGSAASFIRHAPAGAVVSPTDAVSAVTVGRRLGLPKRLLAILTGEGLLNDATALTLFTVGVAAVAGTRVVVEQPVLFFLYEVVGGVVIGLVTATVVRFVRARMYDSPLETVLGLVLPFAAYLAAEEIHTSGVLAVVVAGFVMGHHATNVSIPTRLQERSLWATLDMLLEMFVFAYMGLQLEFVIDDVADEGLPVHHVFAYGFAVLVVVILVRPMWVFLNWGGIRMRFDPRHGTTAQTGMNWRQKLVVSWAGMRGVVTLAAAGGVPVLTASGSRSRGAASSRRSRSSSRWAPC